MSAVLHVISDKARHHLPLMEALVASARGGADIIQVRDKKAPAGVTFEFCVELQNTLRINHLQPRVFVNDRVDIALAAQLDGVHLAAKSLPVSAVRPIRSSANWRGLIGCSVHSVEEAIRAAEQGVDYLTFGHIFPSESHPTLAPRGIVQLRQVVEAVDVPVVAIGGIDATNVLSVLETGCSGIAVIGAIVANPSPERATEIIKNQMLKSNVKPKVIFPLKQGERTR